MAVDFAVRHAHGVLLEHGVAFVERAGELPQPDQQVGWGPVVQDRVAVVCFEDSSRWLHHHFVSQSMFA